MVFGDECLWVEDSRKRQALGLPKNSCLTAAFPSVYRLLVYDTGHINNAPINTNSPSIMAKA